MAFILHCDGCHVQNDSLDGNAVIPGVEYMGAPVLTNCAPPRIKVWRDVNVYGKLHDLCNRCIKKINMVLQLPGDAPLDGKLVPEAAKAVLSDIDPEISGRG